MNKWLQIFARDIQRTCLIRIIATVIGLPLGGCLVATAIWAGTRAASQGGGGASFLLMLALALLPLLLVIGGAVGTAATIIWRRGRWLDNLFAPLGLESRSYALVGRQYQGRYHNRQHDIFFYRGPGLLFYVAADSGTRLSVAAQNEMVPQLARLFNGRSLEHNQPALAGLTIFAHDPTWGEAFAGDTAVQAALTRLIYGQDGFLIRQIHVWPDVVCLNLYRTNQMLRFDLEAEQVSEWSDGLLQLAEAIEQLPPPAERLAGLLALPPLGSLLSATLCAGGYYAIIRGDLFLNIVFIGIPVMLLTFMGLTLYALWQGLSAATVGR